ncbi:hypothetical protein AAZV13_09G076850 [Glycine max]
MKKKFPTKHSLSSFTLNPQNWNLSFISVTTPIHQEFTIWKMLIRIKKGVLLLQTCYDERSDLSAEVQDTLFHQHGLCMKKGHALNASIKRSNELKTLDKEYSKESNHCETTNT